MNNSMKKLILILVLVVSNFSFGQDKDVPFDSKMFLDNKDGFKSAVKEIKLGDSHFYKGSESDLSNALSHYLKADEFNHYSANLNYKIGICFLNSTQKFKALDYLIFAKEKSSGDKEFDDIDFHLGQAFHLNEDWEKAIQHYNAYKEKVGDKDKELSFFINKKMGECRTGQELSEKPVRVWVDNLGPEINSEHSDFGPVISADNRMLFFTSRRPGSVGGETNDAGEFFEDIYFSKRAFQGEWGKAENIGEPVNSVSHDAAVGLAPDGKSLLIYRGINKKTGNVLNY